MNTEAFSSYSIYPGEFVTAADETSMVEQMKDSQDNDINLPNTNVKELMDEYKVEVAAPGLTREQLTVYTNDNVLLICTELNERTMHHGESFQRHILLPFDADAELAVAEYKNNTLSCYIPKAKQPARHACTRIIVY